MRAFVVGNFMDANFLQVERLPAAGESLAAQAAFQEDGGKGLNLAVALHRLGVPVDLLMAVGDDAAGRRVTARLRDEGLGTAHVHVLNGGSGYGVGFVAADGRNFLATYQGANGLLATRHVELARQALTQASWVLSAFEVPDAPVLAAFQQAHRQGAKTYLNPSPWRRPSPDLLAVTDVLVVNAQEARLMFVGDLPGTDDGAAWAKRLPSLARESGWRGVLLVVTLGAQGCVALGSSDQVHMGAPFAVCERDATGAGDAFGAGLVAALSQAMPVDVALRMANACGALLVLQPGVWAHLPTLTQVQAVLDGVHPALLNRFGA